MKKTLSMWAAVCTLLLCVATQAAQLPKLETRVKTVAVFKNGLGFVFRSGKTPLVDGWADMSELPAAALGTLWIGTTNPLERVEEVVAYKGTSDKERDAQSLAELVDLNVGSALGFTYTTGTGEAKWIQGKVLSSSPQIVLIEAVGHTTPNSPAPRTARVAIKKDSIQSIDFLDSAAVTKAKDTSTANRAKARVGGKAKSAEITMAYLEKGMTWSPSYLVNIRDEKTADITLEAVLANDVEDLEDTEVSFVVGYPSFSFADLTSPISLQQSVASFIASLTSGRPDNYGGYGGIMSQSVAYNIGNRADFDFSDGAASWRPEATYSAAKPMAGESNEDLFFYRQQHVTLKKGDRARYTVFTGKAPYAHEYELNVPDSMYVDYYGNRTSDRNTAGEDPQVWHVLRLENTTGQPWTTAPALAVNGSMPVAQDTLKYTPPKGRNTLKLTVATDVHAQQEQVEESRKQVRILYNDYYEVTVTGKLTIRSYKAKPVQLSVKKSIVGEVQESSAGSKVVKLAKRLAAVNPDSQVSWDFELAPGAEKVLIYQYKVLVH